QATVVVRLEEVLGELIAAGEAIAAVHGANQDRLAGFGGDLGLERLRLLVARRDQLLDAAERGDALVEDLRLAEEANELVAELGLQRVAPALVLLEAAVEALPASGRQLVRFAVRVRQLHLLELVAQQQLLELGLLLDVGLLLAVLQLV